MGQARYYRLSYGDLSWVELGYDSAGRLWQFELSWDSLGWIRFRCFVAGTECLCCVEDRQVTFQ